MFEKKLFITKSENGYLQLVDENDLLYSLPESILPQYSVGESIVLTIGRVGENQADENELAKKVLNEILNQ